jgi:hypothetical protein
MSQQILPLRQRMIDDMTIRTARQQAGAGGCGELGVLHGSVHTDVRERKLAKKKLARSGKKPSTPRYSPHRPQPYHPCWHFMGHIHARAGLEDECYQRPKNAHLFMLKGGSRNSRPSLHFRPAKMNRD